MKIAKNILIPFFLGIAIGASVHGSEQQASPVPRLEYKNSDEEYRWTLIARSPENNKIMGYLQYEQRQFDKRAWCMHRLEVFKEYQRKGVGSFLFAQAIMHIKENNPHEIKWVAGTLASSETQLSLKDLASIYRKLCANIQPILPGLLREQDNGGTIDMIYKVKRDDNCWDI